MGEHYRNGRSEKLLSLFDPLVSSELDGELGWRRSVPMTKKGYLPHPLVKCVVFWTLTLCILTAKVAGILHAWELLDDVGLGRCVWTTFILACGSSAFLFINYLFGELGYELFSGTGPGQPPRFDPAFGDRLRKAKVDSDEEKDLKAG